MGLLDFLGEADLAGFNVARFDAAAGPRVRDCGMDLRSTAGVIDVMTIFHRKEPRHSRPRCTHLGRAPPPTPRPPTRSRRRGADGAAGALRRSSRPSTSWTADLSRPADAVDRQGKFVMREGKVTFAFGRHRGKPLPDEAASDPDYLSWLLTCDFPADARSLIEGALRGELPRC